MKYAKQENTGVFYWNKKKSRHRHVIFGLFTEQVFPPPPAPLNFPVITKTRQEEKKKNQIIINSIK